MSEVMESVGFDYVSLAEIDPSQQPLPTDVYELKIVKAAIERGVSKTTNKPYECVSFGFAVTNSEKYSGRRVWERFFGGEFGLKAMRRIMDATGVPQVGTLEDWLKELATIQPTFKVTISEIDEVDRLTKQVVINPVTGKPQKTNKVNWYNVVPA
jgi:hypothetical protein